MAVKRSGRLGLQKGREEKESLGRGMDTLEEVSGIGEEGIKNLRTGGGEAVSRSCCCCCIIFYSIFRFASVARPIT